MCCSVVECGVVRRVSAGSTTRLQLDILLCYSVLQCVAVCCSVLQCVAVCCYILQSQTARHALCDLNWIPYLLYSETKNLTPYTFCNSKWRDVW